ncbi:hypothetical protein A9W99_17890 [Mycobacterium sp. 1164966.3]|uniref:hypothetical protein n=1 Tax=Mycobacterium sp. 1164966.3 TaxID=1856861 RepID=UPI0007FDCC16|nr:hypothetical protein [Mycobacterium sp. 1164966.3]OBA79988.1 hypothetical protein A9W99_17890 [Mycobacterium sp. 1164966.3]
MNTFPLMLPSDGFARFAVISAVFLIILGAVATWVYLDAKEQAQRGNPVVYSMESFEVRTPARWSVCCLLLVELFFPLYLDSRSMTG